jgi:hypothetical protein
MGVTSAAFGRLEIEILCGGSLTPATVWARHAGDTKTASAAVNRLKISEWSDRKLIIFTSMMPQKSRILPEVVGSYDVYRRMCRQD